MFDAIEELVLGLVQGVTEFLPVSSSGHLVVVPALLGWDEPSLEFDVLLHVATLLAVVVYFRRDLAGIAADIVGRGDEHAEGKRLAVLIGAATVPAGVAGLALEDQFERLFEEPLWVCLFWVVTAALLLSAERVGRREGDTERLDLRIALVVGVAQAVAIVPGISRAGATIVAGMWMGLPRAEAARFSFLLSIPVIAGGGLTLVPDVASGSFDITGAVLVGVAAAALSGYAAIAGLLRILRTRSLTPFVAYLLVAAPVSAVLL